MYFNTLVQGFTRRGFSVRWSVIPLIQYGLPQDRKRLLMIGACPGEQLPPWPPATHSATPRQGQKPFVTEAEALRGLNSRRVSLHDVARAAVRNGSRRDANLPFPKTITCGGTQGILHPSGTRDFTVREIASLQGFPIYHEFEGNKTAIKKQIGNAFPSCVVKNIYDHLRKWLEEVDGVQRAAPAQARLPAPPVPRPVVDRRRRENPPHALPLEPQHLVNGDLHEDEALQLALQESMHGHHPSASGAIIEISDDEGKQQDSPVSAVAPLLKRMSIALSNHRAEFDSQSRSRSVTLDFSPSPSPGPSRHAKAASQKRSLDLMHDGEADEVMKEASPPKRERVLEAGNHAEGTIDKIPSALPRYAGPQNAHDSANEVVFVDQSKRDSQNGVRKSNSTPEEHDSHRATIAGETAPRKSSYTIDWSSILSQAKMAGNFGNEVWTF
ncbi:hypothetical protein FJTKL_14547 [Diaporthe vaccinii]|uniref:DNA (cytosine-5-)-methyltransferase n=1 Tax=Diaporthe vaccinii TaxID=105482 RepID=A0ABR4E7F2_9PEZI